MKKDSFADRGPGDYLGTANLSSSLHDWTDGDIPASELLYDAFASTLFTEPPLEQAVPNLFEPLDGESSFMVPSLPDLAMSSSVDREL